MMLQTYRLPPDPLQALIHFLQFRAFCLRLRLLSALDLPLKVGQVACEAVFICCSSK